MRRAGRAVWIVSPKSSNTNGDTGGCAAVPHAPANAERNTTVVARRLKNKTDSFPNGRSPQRRMVNAAGITAPASYATSPPPRTCLRGANVGRLLAPGRLSRLPDSAVSGAVRRRVLLARARYSGGAAPVLHRLPCPAFAINCEAKLYEP